MGFDSGALICSSIFVISSSILLSISKFLEDVGFFLAGFLSYFPFFLFFDGRENSITYAFSVDSKVRVAGSETLACSGYIETTGYFIGLTFCPYSSICCAAVVLVVTVISVNSV